MLGRRQARRPPGNQVIARCSRVIGGRRRCARPTTPRGGSPGLAGNHVGISEVGEDELPRVAAERPPVVAGLERDAVTLAGVDARGLLTSATGSGE